MNTHRSFRFQVRLLCSVCDRQNTRRFIWCQLIRIHAKLWVGKRKRKREKIGKKEQHIVMKRRSRDTYFKSIAIFSSFENEIRHEVMRVYRIVSPASLSTNFQSVLFFMSSPYFERLVSHRPDDSCRNSHPRPYTIAFQLISVDWLQTVENQLCVSFLLCFIELLTNITVTCVEVLTWLRSVTQCKKHRVYSMP